MEYKLLSYQSDDGPCAGVMIGEKVFNAQELSTKTEYTSVLGILADWDASNALFSEIKIQDSDSRGAALSDIQLLAPILYPGQIWAAGANYQDHIGEMADSEFTAVNAKAIGGRPWHYSKTSRSAVIGHGSVYPLPAYSKMVDWEIELAVVIGRMASRVSADEALNYVAGYTIANDLSARDYVVRDGIDESSPFRYDWLSQKGFDGACPMGPWIIPAQQIVDPQALDLKLWVDDELMQDSNTKHMIFSIAEQIEEISARTTMHPGDVVMTGAPAGVGMGRGIFLRSGQNVKLFIENIGELHHGFS